LLFLQYRASRSVQVEKYMVAPTDLNSPEGFKFFLYQMQVHQSMAVRTQSEFYRRGMTNVTEWPFGRTMGALFWQTNEIWPGASWASIGEHRIIESILL
jgi:beta-mannosidase